MNIELDYKDYQDFDDAAARFCAALTTNIVSESNSDTIVWDIHRYDTLLGKPLRFDGASGDRETLIDEKLNRCPNGVSKSLWRQALLNHMHGLYNVTSKQDEVGCAIYQIRGYDIANMTIVETADGLVVIDCLTVSESAKAAMNLYWDYTGSKLAVKAIIITHSHVDHYGGIQGVLDVNQARAATAVNPVEIYAPAKLTEEAALENCVVGDAMYRRAQYMYGGSIQVYGAEGATVPEEFSKIDMGLGKDGQSGGSGGFVQPTHIVIPEYVNAEKLPSDFKYVNEDTPIQFGGIDFEFTLCPGTEAPSEMTIWVGDMRKCLVAAEIANHTLHNTLTPRGAEVRDARLWWKALDKLITKYGDQISVVCATHHWPVWGNEASVHFLAQQRDTYKFLHDQTVHLMNQGYTMLEIAQQFDDPAFLPVFMRNEWHNRGYYGTISHDVRAIYQKYLGWFDMHPSNLDPLPPVDVAKRYISAMGGEAAVRNTINSIRYNPKTSTAADYRWAAELGKHLVFAYPENSENRYALAGVFRRLASPCEAGTWRNIYLAGALDLESSPAERTGASANPALLAAVEDDLLFDYMASRLNAQRAMVEEITLDVTQTDRKTVYRLTCGSAGVLNFHEVTGKSNLPKCCRMELERSILIELILNPEMLDNAIKENKVHIISIDGEDGLASVKRLFSLLDKSLLSFPIVLPS